MDDAVEKLVIVAGHGTRRVPAPSSEPADRDLLQRRVERAMRGTGLSGRDGMGEVQHRRQKDASATGTCVCYLFNGT